MINKNLLILGHSGFIGQNFLRSLKISKNIYLISRKKINYDKEYQYDIFSNFKWFNLIKNNSTIIFLAFDNNLYKLEKDKSYLKRVNNFCEAFKKFIDKKKIKVSIIFTSTVTIYGLTKKNKIIDEDFKDNPSSNYDKSKNLIEKNFIKYSKSKLIKFVSLRLSNIYGYYGNSSQTNRGFLNKLILQIYKNKKIFIYGSGNNLRSYVYIDDLIRAIKITIKKINKLNGKVFIICGNRSHSFMDLIKIVSNSLGRNVLYAKKRYPKNINIIEKRSFVGNNKLFKKYTNWQPKVNLVSGINKIVWLLKKNEYNN